MFVVWLSFVCCCARLRFAVSVCCVCCCCFCWCFFVWLFRLLCLFPCFVLFDRVIYSVVFVVRVVCWFWGLLFVVVVLECCVLLCVLFVVCCCWCLC